MLRRNPLQGLDRVWGFLLFLLLLALWLALAVGQYPISAGELLSVLLHGSRAMTEGDAALATVVWQLRLPRLLAAVVVGASLAAAGAAYQGMFRNPLVSPDILGVSAGAGLGAVLGLLLGWPPALIQAMALAGGLLAVGLVVLVASLVRRHDAVLVLVLSGVAVGTFLGAIISVIKILADPYTQLASITFWLLGGLSTVRLADLLPILPLALAGLLILFLLRWRIDFLSLADDEARALGLDIRRLRGWLILAATLMTASAVSFTGIIGWVGLVVPHMARLLVGPRFVRLLPASMVLGASFLLLIDTLARSSAGMELPLGVLTALLGAPFFLYLLARGREAA
ncbi:MAG: iron ABC transporter permease [Castellaniella sp.]